jgi:chromosome segregation ATPase
MLAGVPFYPVAGATAAIAGLVLLAGLVAGQFRRGVVEELRAALNTAKDEIEIERGRGDRLESEMRKQREVHDAELREMRDDINGLHAQLELANRDRDLMRQLIAMQTQVPQALTDAIASLTKQSAEHITEHVDARTQELKTEVIGLKEEVAALKAAALVKEK